MSAPILRYYRRIPLGRLRSQRCLRREFNQDTVAQILKKDVGSEVTVKGWVKAVRRHKDVCFVNVTDGLSPDQIQLVVDPSRLPQTVTSGASIAARGQLVKSLKREQPVEVTATEVTVIGDCPSDEFPFLPRTAHPPDYVRKYLHLRPKTSSFAALLRVRSEATAAIRKYFSERSYININTPVLTATDCEGGGETFLVSQNVTKGNQEPYFKHPVFLTVSGQLHLEVACGGLARVYTLGPAFRADNAIDRTHLSEFYMLEAELAFVNTLGDLLSIMEDLLKSLCSSLLQSRVAEDIDHFHKATPSAKAALERMLHVQTFPKMTYTDAISLLRQNQDKFDGPPVTWGCDLLREHERFLVSAAGDVPLFVTDFPCSHKPFYMRQNDSDGGTTVACTDLLVPGPGELCGGSLREERLGKLADALSKKGMAGDYSWYLDLRKFGSTPHCGFGMGFERFLQFLLGIPQIRDTIPFPRYVSNCRM